MHTNYDKFFPTISEQTYGNVYILSKFFEILFKKLINNQILILKKYYL